MDYSFLLVTFFLASSALAETCDKCDAGSCQCVRPRNCRLTMDVLRPCHHGFMCCPDVDVLQNHKRIEAWPQFSGLSKLNYIDGSWIDFPEGQRIRTTTTTTTASPATDDEGGCGTRANRERVSGGEEATLGDYPWIVALRYQAAGNSSDVRNLCAGSLISRQHVLTAAHCLKIPNYNLVSVVAGEHDIRTDPDCMITKEHEAFCSTAVVVPTDRTHSHRRYNVKTSSNDIAVVKLQREVDITPTVRTICLPSNDTKLAPRDPVLIAGWGKNATDSPPSPVLLHTSIEVQDFDLCTNIYQERRKRIFSPQMFCAGNGTRDACRGDSGGPLMREFNRKYHVMGVVSFGYEEYCGLPTVPGVYTNVTNYVKWINDAVHDLQTTN